MRKLAACALVLALTSCGGGEPKEVPQGESGQMEHEPSSSPDVSVTAAPGVAFNYRYAFRLPANRVAAVQEQHAQTCERLGISRCRITGMLYRLVNEKDIEAHLEFKLEPALARQFGKAGVEAVDRAEGMLTESEITGEDAGAAIQSANRNEGELAADLARIEAQLAQPGLAAQERARLQEEAQRLRESIRAIRADKTAKRDSLANTPVTFQYGSGGLVPGFDNRSPLGDALDQAGQNVVGSLAIILMLLITLVPWMAIGLLGWLLAKPIRRRFTRRVATPAQASAH